MMIRLVPLLPERHIGIYKTSAKKLCQALSGSSSSAVENVDPSPKKVLASSPGDLAKFHKVNVLVSGNPVNETSLQLKSSLNCNNSKICSNSKLITQESKVKSTIQSLDSVYKRVRTELGDDGTQDDKLDSSGSGGISQAITQSSSKRAREMVLSMGSKKTTTSSMSPSLKKTKVEKNKTSLSGELSILQKIGRITAGKKDNKEENSSGGTSQEQKKRLICTICNERVSSPYAARCGHVCCIDCWHSWFKQKDHNSCPLCRREVQVSQLVKLNITD